VLWGERLRNTDRKDTASKSISLSFTSVWILEDLRKLDLKALHVVQGGEEVEEDQPGQVREL